MIVLGSSICDECVRECIRVLHDQERADLGEALARLPTSCVLCSTPLAEDDAIELPVVGATLCSRCIMEAEQAAMLRRQRDVLDEFTRVNRT